MSAAAEVRLSFTQTLRPTGRGVHVCRRRLTLLGHHCAFAPALGQQEITARRHSRSRRWLSGTDRGTTRATSIWGGTDPGNVTLALVRSLAAGWDDVPIPCSAGPAAVTFARSVAGRPHRHPERGGRRGHAPHSIGRPGDQSPRRALCAGPRTRPVVKRLLTRYVEGDNQLRRSTGTSGNPRCGSVRRYSKPTTIFCGIFESRATKNGTGALRWCSLSCSITETSNSCCGFSATRSGTPSNGVSCTRCFVLRCNDACSSFRRNGASRSEAARRGAPGARIPADPVAGSHELRPVLAARGTMGTPLVCALVQRAGSATGAA